ncbi:nuclear pore complex protein Nup205-like [Schistocerca gregaria]|uniref:nuclear pore complex protein Nup205-like n=1 Tax=Schistocerca gregaria TaxID=7010 RepID=UPI00211F0886|nr:nuclear pore complex protein Nup205-like [Schistocerca gregaria]
MDSKITSADLLHTISSCLHHTSPESSRNLQILLRQHHSTFLDPLYKQPCSPDDRKTVLSREFEIHGTRRRLSEDFSRRAIMLSDNLQLNEISCVQLLWRACETQQRHIGTTIQEIAEYIFYKERLSVLLSLLMLFGARNNASIDSDVSSLVNKFTDELLSEGLVKKLIELIRERASLEEEEAAQLGNDTLTLNTPSEPSSNEKWIYKRKERQCLTEILLYIAYQTTIQSEDILLILDLAREVSIRCGNSWIVQIAENSNMAHSLLQVNYCLLAVLVCVLDVCSEHDLVNPKTGERRSNSFLENQDFVNFNKKLLSKWKADGHAPESHQYLIQPIIVMSWALFLKKHATRRYQGGFRAMEAYASSDAESSVLNSLLKEDYIDSLVTRAIGENFSEALTKIIEHPIFSGDKDKHVYLEIFDELIRSFLDVFSGKVREIKNEEEEGLRSQEAYLQYNVGPKPMSVPRYFGQFLKLISALYDEQPSLAIRFWDKTNYPNLSQFVRMSADNLFEANFVAYMSMLCSLASGEYCAQMAFCFLEDSSRKYINWNHFFRALDKYFLEYQEPAYEGSGYYDHRRYVGQTGASRTIRPEEVGALEAILKMMQKVLKWSAQVRKIILDNPEWRVLQVLFQLLTCPIDPGLKAHLIRTITQFARDANVQPRIWQYMNALQILPSNSITSSPLNENLYNQRTNTAVKPGSVFGSKNTTLIGSIRFELLEIESERKEYPYTIAFLDLLNMLLTDHYYGNHDTLADIDLWSYVDFVIHDVFERFNQRGYKDLKDQWSMARPSLRILLAVLRDAVNLFCFEEFGEMKRKSVTGGHIETTNLEPHHHSSTFNPEIRYGVTCLRLFGYFLQKSSLLKKLITIIVYGHEHLANRVFAGSGTDFEASIRYCLLIIETVLLYQDYFLAPNVSSQLSAGLDQKPEDGNQVLFERIDETQRVMLTPLHELLLSELSGISAIAMYIAYPHDETISRLSVSIIHLLSRPTSMSSKLVRVITRQGILTNWIAGYVEKLEQEDRSYEDELAQVEIENRGAHADDKYYWTKNAPPVREAILNMLLECATQPAPNLTQLLIGISPTEIISCRNASNKVKVSGIGHSLSHSGAWTTSQSSLKSTSEPNGISILEVLVRLVDQQHSATTSPKLACLVQQLIYTLLKQSSTQFRVTRFLRSQQQDFFYRQLAATNTSSMPGRTSVEQNLEESQTLLTMLMEQRGWMLKSVALELHTTHGTQRSYTMRLLNVLYSQHLGGVDSSAKESEEGESYSRAEWQNDLCENLIEQERMKMHEFLDPLGLSISEPELTIEGFFYYKEIPANASGGGMGAGSAALNLNVLTELDERRFPKINMQGLKAQLAAHQARLESLYALTADQCEEMAREKEVILQRATAWNRFYQMLGAQFHLFEGWQQVLEVTLLECGHLLGDQVKEVMVFEIIEAVLSHFNSRSDVHLQIRWPLSSCILLLMTELRQVHTLNPLVWAAANEKSSKTVDLETIAGPTTEPAYSSVSKAGGKGNVADYERVHFERLNGGAGPVRNGLADMSFSLATGEEMYHSVISVHQMLTIFRALTTATLKQGNTCDIRYNLYGALLHYFQFTLRATTWLSSHAMLETSPIAGDAEELASIKMHAQILQRERQLYSRTVKHLHTVIDALLEVIATDASDAPALHKSVAYATLDALARYEHGWAGQSSYQELKQGLSRSKAGGIKWILHLTQRGFLRYFLEAIILEDDQALKQILTSSAISMSALYVFESKMSMLLSISSTPTGATTLIDLGLLQVLRDFQCIDQRPDGYQQLLETEKQRARLYQTKEEGNCLPEMMEPNKSVYSIHEEILMPVLRLLVAVLTQLPRNSNIVSQVIQWLDTHSELVTELLRDQRLVPTAQSLQQLTLITGIFYHLSPHRSLISQRLQAYSKYQQLLLMLLVKYIGPSHSNEELKEDASTPRVRWKQLKNEEFDLLCSDWIKLLRNLIGICRRLSICSLSTSESYDQWNTWLHTGQSIVLSMHHPTAVLFSPSITATSSLSPSSWPMPASPHPSASLPIEQPVSRDHPPLFVLILHLKACLNQIQAARKEIASVRSKLDNASQLKSEELLEIIHASSSTVCSLGITDQELINTATDHYPLFQLQQITQYLLGLKQVQQQSKISLLYHIIENALLILWKHLTHYLHCHNEEQVKETAGSPYKMHQTPVGQDMLINKITFDKKQLLREATSSLDTLFHGLEKLPVLAERKTHIIPICIRRLKDTLKMH